MALAWSLACAGVAAAQNRPARSADSATVLILEHRFTGAAPDSSEVRLDKNLVYRMELLGSGGTPDIRPPGHGAAAFSARLDSESRPGRAQFEMYPFTTGLHFVRMTGLSAADTVLLRIYSDSAGSVAEQARVLQHAGSSWTLGFELSAGTHSSFMLNTGPLAPADTAPTGVDAELGLVFASSFNPLSAAAGVSVEPIAGSETRGTWFFFEPRVRLLRRGTIDGGILLHVAQGSFNRSTISPDIFAGGVIVTKHFSHDALRRGLAMQLRYFYGRVSNVSAPHQHVHHLWLGVSWKP